MEGRKRWVLKDENIVERSKPLWAAGWQQKALCQSLIKGWLYLGDSGYLERR
jgi:hypothetical protein